VTRQVPRTVQTCNASPVHGEPIGRIRMDTQKYQVSVTTFHSRMVPVTKKVPKTVYVDITTQVPQNYKTTTLQTRERQVPVPYFVNIPETKCRTVTYQVPVQRTRVQMDTVTKTVFDTQMRTGCVPETKIVTKQIPVYNVVARPAPPCPPGADCGDGTVAADFNCLDKDGDGQQNNNEIPFDIADANMDGQFLLGEYAAARASGDLGNIADFGQSYGQTSTSGFGQTMDRLIITFLGRHLMTTLQLLTTLLTIIKDTTLAMHQLPTMRTCHLHVTICSKARSYMNGRYIPNFIFVTS